MRILLSGYQGRMGKAVREVAAEEGIQVVPCITEGESVDAAIDFSHASRVESLLTLCREREIPCVIGTTGLGELQEQAMDRAAEKIPVLYSANFSVGVRTLIRGIEAVAPLLAEAGFDAAITEYHHKNKKDAPSGTAKMLAEAVRKEMDRDFIPILSARAGTIPGSHQILFAGPDETLLLIHQAYSRTIFARGAVNAAKYLVRKPAGRYRL